MDAPEEPTEAEMTEGLVPKKLMEIMDLQADIDALLRDNQAAPFGSKNWQNACPEALQRLVAMAATQFLLFEPIDWVKRNDELKVVAEKMIKIILAQLKTLKTK